MGSNPQNIATPLTQRNVKLWAKLPTQLYNSGSSTNNKGARNNWLVLTQMMDMMVIQQTMGMLLGTPYGIYVVI